MDDVMAILRGLLSMLCVHSFPYFCMFPNSFEIQAKHGAVTTQHVALVRREEEITNKELFEEKRHSPATTSFSAAFFFCLLWKG